MSEIEDLNRVLMQKRKDNPENKGKKPMSEMESLIKNSFAKAKKLTPVKVVKSKEYQVLRTLNVPKRYKTALLSDYNFDDKILNKYLRLLKKATDYGKGLNLLGVNGVGKTRFIHALIREYVLLNSDEYFEECKKNIKVVKFLEVYKNLIYPANDTYIDMLKKCDLLVIDDFLKINITELQLSFVNDIIDYRYEYMKPTITTSNVTIEEMAKKCGKTLWDRLNNVNYSKEIIDDSLRPKYDNFELED